MQLIEPSTWRVSTALAPTPTRRTPSNTHHKKLSISVPVTSVHTTGSLVLSFNWYTQEWAAPVTFSGAVPLRKSCGLSKMSEKRVCESNRPALAVRRMQDAER